MRNSLITLFMAASLGGCATDGQVYSNKIAQGTARVEVVDHNTWLGEPFRHIRWNGENYGPTSFVGVARNKKVQEILLLNPSRDNTRCIAALATALSIPASALDSATGSLSNISQSQDAVDEVCTIVYEIPHPALPAGHYYVAQTSSGLAIEGEAATDPRAFTAKLRQIGASAIVLRKPSIAELLCFGSVAAEAKVQLLKVKVDGSLFPLSVNGGSLSKSCNI